MKDIQQTLFTSDELLAYCDAADKEKITTIPQLIKILEHLDLCIVRALELNDDRHLHIYNYWSERLVKIIAEIKGHIHIPKHLEYLLPRFSKPNHKDKTYGRH